MRFSQIAVLLVAILAMPAAAQQSANPVTQHYHAYRVALERGDLAAADTEATAALGAAQLSPANVNNVAALAMNAALARLSLGHRDQALAPAQLAASLANNAHSGVDPMAVDIVVKRAALRLGDQSENDLLASLNAAQAHGGLDEYVYDGGADLGGWATQQEHFPIALSAWQLASHASPGDSDAAILSRAHALIEASVSMFRIETDAHPANPPRQSQPLPLGNGESRSSYQPNLEIYTTLAEAARITRPLAERAAADGSLTQAQLLFARAIAFLRAEYSRLGAIEAERSSLHFVSGSLKLASHPGATLCDIHAIPQPMPSYPPGAANDLHVAGVVVRFVVDSSGRVTDARVVATVGGAVFEHAVSSVAGRWHVERNATSSAGCDMAMTLFVPIEFNFEN
jgi:TonB family protein